MISLPGSNVVRIVAYNFLSGGSARRSGHWSRLTRSLTPTIVLAQECRTPDQCARERFRPGPLDALLWQPVVGRRWGSALLSRGGAVTPLEVPGFEGWVTGGETQLPALSNGRPLRIFSIHAPAGEHGYIRTMQQLLDGIAPLRTTADLVLGGDFNVATGYRGQRDKITMSRGERNILDRLADEFDLVSCWQAVHPNRPLAQTLRWSANRTAPYHCDGIFVPRRWLDRLVSCRVVRGSRWDALSDHSPVIAEFRSTTP